MPNLALSAELDRHALDLRDDAGDPYEVAISLARAADRVAMGSSSGEMEAATAIRDSFGTWAEHIHAYGGGEGDLATAERAQQHVQAALRAWDTGAREDLSAFAKQCRSQVATVNTAWLQESGTPLARSSLIQWMLRRLGF